VPSEEKLRKLQDDPGWQKCRDSENQLIIIFESGARIRPGKTMLLVPVVGPIGGGDEALHILPVASELPRPHRAETKGRSIEDIDRGLTAGRRVSKPMKAYAQPASTDQAAR
jgi:hypothetical protein